MDSIFNIVDAMKTLEEKKKALNSAKENRKVKIRVYDCDTNSDILDTEICNTIFHRGVDQYLDIISDAICKLRKELHDLTSDTETANASSD